MPDYIFLMHNDGAISIEAWGPYLAKLRADGRLQGGSAIGAGICVRKTGTAPAVMAHLGGFVRIAADNLEQARSLVAGNPVFEAGGTVEIRELPQTD